MRGAQFRRVAAWLALALVFGGLAGCSEEKVEGTPLAKVGDKVITREALDNTFLGLPNEERQQYLSRPGRQQLLDNLVMVELLYQEALRQGLDRNPEIKVKLEGAERQILVDELISRSVDKTEIYRMFQTGFIKARSLVIVFPENPTPTEQAVGEKTARRIHAELAQGTDWNKLAALEMPAPFSLSYHDWGCVDREKLQEALGTRGMETVFGLKRAGQFTEPMPIPEGLVITQVLELSGELDPGGFTEELAVTLLNRKKEEVYRGYSTDLQARRQSEIKTYAENVEEFLSVADRPAPAAGSTLEPQDASTASAE